MNGHHFDPPKRDRTLRERGPDFAEAREVFAGDTLDFEDDRKAYPERRYICVGYLHERMVVVVWTPKEAARHVISMRKANEREQAKYGERFG